MALKILFTFLIWLVCYLLILGPLGLLIIPVLWFTDWDGKTTWWGNRKYGRTEGFWFLALRNPISNFGKEGLAIKHVGPVNIQGNTSITDGKGKVAGWYYIRLQDTWKGWEIRCVYPTFPGKCFEARVGWKLFGNIGDSATFVFRANPFKKFG